MAWVNPVGVSVSGASLTKTATTVGWNAGAASSRAINGDGSLEFTVPATPGYVMCGLSNGDTDQGNADIDYALYTDAGAIKIYIFEKGTYRGSFGAFAPGDKLKVAVEAGVVKYYRNGTHLYTSLQTPTLPLKADTSLSSLGATVQEATLSGTLTGSTGPATEPVVWVNPVGVSVSGANVTKTATTVGWNAGAASSRAISGDGSLQFTVPATPGYVMCGLSNGDTDQGNADIDFALYTDSGAVKIYIFEKGTYRGSFGAFAPGDKLKVAVEAGVVKYYRNGTHLYTSLQAPTLPLRADASLSSAGAMVQDAVLTGALVSAP